MTSITFSFVPSEIIAPGTILELRASRDVQPESAAIGVRLTQAGNKLPAGIIVKGNIIQVPPPTLAPLIITFPSANYLALTVSLSPIRPKSPSLLEL